MTATKVKLGQFTGLSKLHSKEAGGLASILRGLAIDNARIAIAVSSMTDFTDNSTGTSNGTVKQVTLPTAVIDASSLSVGSPVAGLNTAMGIFDNAVAVVAQQINLARTRLGLTLLTDSTGGTVATPGTIPAITKALTATTGTGCATKASVVAKLGIVRANVYKLALAHNEVLVAMGLTPLTINMTGNISSLLTLADSGTATASATGADAASDTVVDAALVALADSIAAIAASWNAAMAGTSTATTPLNVVAG